MEALKEEKVGNYAVKVYYDEFAESPREWDDLSVIYSNHRRYDPDNHTIDEILNEEGELVMDGKVGLAVWLFEHSGCSFKTAEIGEDNPFGNGMYARFDSGWFGVIAMPIEKAKKEWGKDWEERAKDWMRVEIETFNQYAQGRVYMMTVEDCNGEVIDFCGSFYDEDEALEEGISIAEEKNEEDKEEIEQLLNESTLDELKEKFYEMAKEAPTWADEVFELVDEDKAKEWLKGKLKQFLHTEDEDWKEI